MSSTSITCPKGVWTVINSASVSGAIVLREGGVIFTESPTPPVGGPDDNAWSGTLSVNGDSGYYANVAAGDLIYAYAARASLLNVTPVGGVI